MIDIEIKLPTTRQLEEELQRVKYRFKYKKILKSTIYVLVIVIALSVLVSTLIFPVLEIYGDSMTPTFSEGDVVVTVKKSKFETGDIIAFYYNNRILVKRVIAISSEWVNIDDEGNVFVNDELLEEPYIEEKSYGDTDIVFPYQVPEGSYFVLGDQRVNSIDSRNSLIGSISEEDIISKVIFKVWPLKSFGIVK